MSSSEIDKFSHRHNEDGTVDSICRFCFVTIARMKSEDALGAFEEAHVCDEYALERFWQIQKPDTGGVMVWWKK